MTGVDRRAVVIGQTFAQCENVCRVIRVIPRLGQIAKITQVFSILHEPAINSATQGVAEHQKLTDVRVERVDILRNRNDQLTTGLSGSTPEANHGEFAASASEETPIPAARGTGQELTSIDTAGHEFGHECLRVVRHCSFHLSARDTHVELRGRWSHRIEAGAFKNCTRSQLTLAYTYTRIRRLSMAAISWLAARSN